MEKPLSYVLKLSLEQMALRRLAIALNSHPRILGTIAEYRGPEFWDPDYRFNASQCHIILEDKISRLGELPKSLTEQMVPLSKAVLSELITWNWIHYEHLGTTNSSRHACLKKVCWTAAGTVDYRKTAEELVRCGGINAKGRFELACLYCLEDWIPVLWEELPNEIASCFYYKDATSRGESPSLQLLLPCIISKQLKGYHRWFASNWLEKAALCLNITLTEYLFRRLTKEERDASLVRVAETVIAYPSEIHFNFRRKLSEMACFLLSLMTPQEQIGIFRKLPCEVLARFLDWPWQDLFLDIADVIWTFLPEHKYEDLAHAVYHGISDSDYYSPYVYQDLFLRSPMAFRKSFVDLAITLYLWIFFNNKDMETIRVIFRNVEDADRVRLVLCEKSLDFILGEEIEWHTKETFLRAAALSKEEKGRLKVSFIEFASIRERRYANSIDLLREEHRNFFKFVGEADASSEAREVEKTRR